MKSLLLHLSSVDSRQRIELFLESAFAIPKFVEHDSIQYSSSGSYRMGTNDQWKIKLLEEDTIGFDDFSFELHMIPLECDSTMEIKDAVIEKLLERVKLVGICEYYSAQETHRRIYSLDSNGEMQSRNEIVYNDK